MNDSIVIASPSSTTTTHAAGDWRSMDRFCFLQGPVASETFPSTSFAPSPDLIDAINDHEDQEDARLADEARAALADPAERPTIAWSDVRERVK